MEHQRTVTQSYALSDALLYVFRGKGPYVVGAYLAILALLTIVGFVPVLGVGAGCLALVFVGVVLFLMPGALFAIVRTTAAGDNEIPDWPDLRFAERLPEVIGFVGSGFVATLPLVLMLGLAGCLGGASLGIACWLVIAIGWLVAAALWVPIFGSIAVHYDNWLLLRLDLHAAAISRGGTGFWLTVFLAAFFALGGQALSVVLAPLPVLGLIVSAAIALYGWFTAAHLIGLQFQRNDVLKRLYERP